MPSPALPARPPAPFILLLLAALLWPAVSCTSPGSRVAPRGDSPHAVGQALEATYAAWQHLPEDHARISPQETRWRAALGGLLTALDRHSSPETWTGSRSIGGWTVNFAGDPSGRTSIPPAWCDQITPAQQTGPASSPASNAVAIAGTGLPVVMRQSRPVGRPEPFLPPNGRYHPATLTADFSGPRRVTLTFHHARYVQSARVNGEMRPLATDIPAAVTRAIDKRFLSRFAFRGLLRPDNYMKVAGIYTVDPFDPKKIPVVLVHGFESAPHIWITVAQAIAADPVLREKFQVWYFLYPTGLSIHSAAALLRETLQKARDYYDPQHRYPAMNEMVMAGHSMGGLLTQMQVIDSGVHVYRAFFTVPVEKLPLSQANLALVKRTLTFNHLPFIKRAVFIATPHHGSKIAEFSISRLLSRLIRPTKLVTGLLREVTSVARSAVNPRLARFRDLGSRTTEGLSPNHPLLAAVNSRPISIPYHTIIAVWKPMNFWRSLEESTDGVVPYSSSVKPGAQSLAVVNSFHTCTEKPEVAEEIARILHIHLGEKSRRLRLPVRDAAIMKRFAPAAATVAQ